ncbi:MAG: glycosyltransferase family 2 protein [Gaiellaceae bacterium]
MPPRVSIIITNHNYARFVGDAIESALAQTHPSCEVVVVDDGSTDDSLAVIGRYRDVLSVVQPNLGQAAAFNAGFGRANGDVLIFLDADDMLAPDTARTVAATFEHEPRVVKVMYRLRVIDESGSPTGELKPPNHLPLRSGDLSRYVLHFPFDMTWMATSGNAFRKSALARIFPVPELDYPLCADYYLSHLTALLGDVVFLDRVGGSYRIHGANSYERAEGKLDLAQVRQTIVYCRHTARHLVELAERLELENRPRVVDDVLSVSELSHRLVSLRLDPERHPLQGDTRTRLLLLGQKAARGRFDVAPPLRLLLAAWMAALALMPRGSLPRLLEARALVGGLGPVSALLGRFHRP